MDFDRFISELKQRNVLRVAGVYAVAAWGVFSIAKEVFEVLDYPREAAAAILALAALGLPVAIGLSWLYERGPDGRFRRTRRSGEGEPRKKLNLIDWAFLGAIAAMMVVFIASAIGLGAALQGGAARKSVAVLPFASFSSVADTQYFADGLTEEVINSLAQVEDLRVAGRTSAFYFKGKDQDMREIGRMLNVSHLVEGSVRRDGEKLRVTAQLINARDGYHLWSETYDRTMDDAFAIQEEIAEGVAEALKAELKAGRRPPAPRRDPALYEREMVAIGKMGEKGYQNVLDAQAIFKELSEKQADVARHHANYAFTTAYLAQNHLEGDFLPSIRLAEAEIATALKLDPKNARAYMAKGMVAAVRFIRESRQSAEVETEAAYRRAAELAPRDGEIQALYGDFLDNTGKSLEAKAVLRRALELDPLNRIARNALADAEFRTFEEEKALANFRKNIEDFPDFVDSKEHLASALMELGRFDEAAPLYQGAAAPKTDPAASLALANLYYNLGMTAEAEAEMASWDKHPIVGPLVLAVRMIVGQQWSELLAFSQKELARSDADPIWRDGVMTGAALSGKPQLAREQLLIQAPELFEPDPQVVIRMAPEAVNNAYVIDQAGDRAQARRILARVLAVTEPKAGVRHPNEYRIARVKAYAMLGEKDLALGELRAVIDDGYRQLYDLEIFMRLDAYPMMAPLRSDPRFAAMIREIEADNARMRAIVQAGLAASSK